MQMWNFSSRVQLEEKFHIYARPCIIIYIFPDIPLNTEAASISFQVYQFIVVVVVFLIFIFGNVYLLPTVTVPRTTLCALSGIVPQLYSSKLYALKINMSISNMQQFQLYDRNKIIKENMKNTNGVEIKWQGNYRSRFQF